MFQSGALYFNERFEIWKQKGYLCYSTTNSYITSWTKSGKEKQSTTCMLYEAKERLMVSDMLTNCLLLQRGTATQSW